MRTISHLLIYLISIKVMIVTFNKGGSRWIWSDEREAGWEGGEGGEGEGGGVEWRKGAGRKE